MFAAGLKRKGERDFALGMGRQKWTVRCVEGGVGLF